MILPKNNNNQGGIPRAAWGHAKERPSASERVRGSCCASEEYFSASERVRGIFLRVREPFLRVRALFK